MSTPMTNERRLTVRPTDADLDHLATIAAALRSTGGLPFATKTDAIRFALATVAASISASAPPVAAGQP